MNFSFTPSGGLDMQGVGGSSPLILTKNPVLTRGRDFYFLPLHYSLFTHSYSGWDFWKARSKSEMLMSLTSPSSLCESTSPKRRGFRLIHHCVVPLFLRKRAPLCLRCRRFSLREQELPRHCVTLPLTEGITLTGE